MSVPELNLTREALYEAIWKTPTCHLAKAYGVSAYVLTKLCQQFGIPKPENDYWPCLKLGYQIEPTPLPAPPAGLPALIRIAPAPGKPKATTATASVAGSQEKSASTTCTEPELAGPASPAAESKLRVAQDFRKAHPLVRQAREVLENARSDTNGFMRSGWRQQCLEIVVTRSSLRRALLLMDAVLRALEARGYSAQLSDERHERTSIRVGRELVRIKISEKTTRKERPLSDAEKQRSYVYNRYSYEPTGVLTFRIDEYHGDARKEWRDGQRQRLEDVLDEIVSSVIATGEALCLFRVAAQEEEKRRIEEERVAWEIHRRREQEKARLLALEKQAEQWHAAERLREFLRACRHALADCMDMSADSLARQWFDWASLHADRIDPLRNGCVNEAVASLPIDSMRLVREQGDKPPPSDAPSSPA
jgi:hypothetical protein